MASHDPGVDTLTSGAPAVGSKATSSLDSIFRPRSVAVVGASRQRHSIGWEILHNLLNLVALHCSFRRIVLFPLLFDHMR